MTNKNPMTIMMTKNPMTVHKMSSVFENNFMLQVVDYVEQVWFLNLSINKIKYLGLIQFDKNGCWQSYKCNDEN